MNLFSPEHSATFFQVQSLCILTIMFVGVYFRKQRTKHIPLMATAMIWDVILILQIELSRGAINKASQVSTNTSILNIHVTIAVLCVILYGLMVYTGRKILNGENSWKKRHRMLGFSTLTLRILTFITSFFTVTTQ